MDPARATGGRVVTFHVVRERSGRQPLVMVRMLGDRWRLRRVAGLRFVRVLGTGRGDDTGPSSDLRRQAYLLVWDSVEEADRFRAAHPVAQRWRRCTVEHDLTLGLASGHGRWSGHDVLDGLSAAPADGRIVVVTRARVRLGSWRALRRVSRTTADLVRRAPGCEWVIGVGEFPVGRLGTVSSWRSMADVERFAADPTHRAAVAVSADWFVESLFARFAPVG